MSPENNEPLTIQAIKEALLPAIVDLFERHAEKTDKQFKAVDKRFEAVDRKFVTFEEIIHETRVLVEHIETKIDMVLELSSVTTNTAKLD